MVAEITVPLSFRFGLPFVLYMDRTVTWDALQKEILEKMRHLLRPGVYIQVAKSEAAGFFTFRFWLVTLELHCTTNSQNSLWKKSIFHSDGSYFSNLI